MKWMIAIVCVVAAFSWTVRGAGDELPVGKIMDVQGDVRIVKQDGTGTVAKFYKGVFRRDTVVTGEKARTKILFTDGSSVVLAEKTTVKIAKYLYERQKRQLQMDLTNGKVKAAVKDVGDGDSLFEIATPAAITGVRGTRYIIVAKDGKTYVWVLEGTVVVSDSAAAASVAVQGGFAASVQAGGTPSAAYVPAVQEQGVFQEGLAMHEPPCAQTSAGKKYPVDQQQVQTLKQQPGVQFSETLPTTLEPGQAIVILPEEFGGGCIVGSAQAIAHALNTVGLTVGITGASLLGTGTGIALGVGVGIGIIEVIVGSVGTEGGPTRVPTNH